MDKKTLNNEVILCRGAVRKAKVAVIRKILKKMKILKTCKVEAMREKKLKKSERLFEKVQMMKRVKADEVTKFALRNKDLAPFLKGPKLDLRQNSLACLAQHDAVMKKINSIRERIPNWETELPLLLDFLGKKNRKKLDNKKQSIKNSKTSAESDDKVIKGGDCISREKVKKADVARKDRATKRGRNTRQKHETVSEDSEQEEKSDRSSIEDLSNSSGKEDKIEKIDDPFFIGKKVIAPKLVLESSSSGSSENNRIGKVRKPGVKRDQFNNSMFHAKVFKTKRDSKVQQLPVPEPEEEKLHPSWAAKKVKMIKPFQGKKIKFSDD